MQISLQGMLACVLLVQRMVCHQHAKDHDFPAHQYNTPPASDDFPPLAHHLQYQYNCSSAHNYLAELDFPAQHLYNNNNNNFYQYNCSSAPNSVKHHGYNHYAFSAEATNHSLASPNSFEHGYNHYAAFSAAAANIRDQYNCSSAPDQHIAPNSVKHHGFSAEATNYSLASPDPLEHGYNHDAFSARDQFNYFLATPNSLEQGYNKGDDFQHIAPRDGAFSTEHSYNNDFPAANYFREVYAGASCCANRRRSEETRAAVVALVS